MDGYILKCLDQTPNSISIINLIESYAIMKKFFLKGVEMSHIDAINSWYDAQKLLMKTEPNLIEERKNNFDIDNKKNNAKTNEKKLHDKKINNDKEYRVKNNNSVKIQIKDTPFGTAIYGDISDEFWNEFKKHVDNFLNFLGDIQETSNNDKK